MRAVDAGRYSARVNNQDDRRDSFYLLNAVAPCGLVLLVSRADGRLLLEWRKLIA